MLHESAAEIVKGTRVFALELNSVVGLAQPLEHLDEPAFLV